MNERKNNEQRKKEGMEYDHMNERRRRRHHVSPHPSPAEVSCSRRCTPGGRLPGMRGSLDYKSQKHDDTADCGVRVRGYTAGLPFSFAKEVNLLDNN